MDGDRAIFDPENGSDSELIANGYEPIPVNGKAPVAPGWQTGEITPERIAREREEHPNAISTGLRTGSLVGNDIDLWPSEHVEAVKRLAAEILGFTEFERVGAKGAMLCYRNAAPIRKIVVSGVHSELTHTLNGEARPLPGKVEILGIGQQFVAYGRHPDTGAPYDWTYAFCGGEPLDTPLHKLPEVRPEMLSEYAKRAAALLTKLGYCNVTVSEAGAQRKRSVVSAAAGSPVSWTELREYLSWINPRFDGARPREYPERSQYRRFHPDKVLSYSSDVWLGIALCLRDAVVPLTDSEEHDWIELIEEWSCGALWYERTREVIDIEDRWPWQGIAARLGGAKNGYAGDGYGIGSIIAYARDAKKWETPAEAFRGYVPPPEQVGDNPPGTERRRGVRLINGANSVARKVTWIWPSWLACGKLHILAGDKGAGKSTLCFALAAALSVGCQWPDGSQAPLGDVLVWSAEDDFEDTIPPRFLAAGGDPNRLNFVECMIGEDGEKLPFDPSRDMRDLIEKARELPDLKMVIIDPIVSAVSGDSHKNAETRRGLQPLVDFAEQAGAALIGITHFTKGTEGKNPVERVTGSLAFAALARIVLAAAANEDGERRRLVRVTSNIGPSGGGIEYRLLQEPLRGYDFAAQRVLWGAQLIGAAKELLEGVRGQSAIMKASSFLLNALADGPMPVNELKKAAEAHGHAWRTVERAKEKLPTIQAAKWGIGWAWGFSAEPSRQTAGYGTRPPKFEEPVGGLPNSPSPPI